MSFKFHGNSYKINFKLVLLIGILCFLVQPFDVMAENGGCWILTDTLSGKSKDYKDRCSEEKIQASEGSVSFFRRYFKGVCNHITEETFSATVTWDRPPSKLLPGETIPLRAKIIREANTHAFFLNLGISISKDAPHCACYSLCSGNQKMGRAAVHSKNNPATAQIDATFKVPTGSKGDAFAIRFCPSGGGHYRLPGWRYIYKWNPDKNAPLRIVDKKTEVQNQLPGVADIEAKPYVIAPGFQEGVQGKLFGVVHKVFIDGKEVTDAERTRLYIGSQIKTSPGVEILIRESSGAQTRVLENTIYEAKERIWKKASRREVYGRLIKGICEFYYPKGHEGYKKFKIETRRAIVGIKGTIFTVSHIDDITTVDVQEGVVEVTNIETGAVNVVQAGERIFIGSKTGGIHTPPLTEWVEVSAAGLTFEVPADWISDIAFEMNVWSLGDLDDPEALFGVLSAADASQMITESPVTSKKVITISGKRGTYHSIFDPSDTSTGFILTFEGMDMAVVGACSKQANWNLHKPTFDRILSSIRF